MGTRPCPRPCGSGARASLPSLSRTLCPSLFPSPASDPSTLRKTAAKPSPALRLILILVNPSFFYFKFDFEFFTKINFFFLILNVKNPVFSSCDYHRLVICFLMKRGGGIDLKVTIFDVGDHSHSPFEMHYDIVRIQWLPHCSF